MAQCAVSSPVVVIIPITMVISIIVIIVSIAMRIAIISITVAANRDATC
jgi:hypothetical protein